MAHQIGDFGFIQAAAKVPAQLSHALGRAEQFIHPRAIGARKTAQQTLFHPWLAQRQSVQEGLEICARNIAAGQAGRFCPGFRHARKVRREFLERMLGQFAIGRDLAAKH